MRTSWPALCALTVLSQTAFATAQTPQPSNKSIARHERDYLRKCGDDTVKDCTSLPELKSLQPGSTKAAAAMRSCATFNAKMDDFCGLVGAYEPDSPQIVSAVRDVIAAKKELMRALGDALKP